MTTNALELIVTLYSCETVAGAGEVATGDAVPPMAPRGACRRYALPESISGPYEIALHLVSGASYAVSV